MTKQHFKYYKYNWNIIVYYNTSSVDKHDIAKILHSIKTPYTKIVSALSTLYKLNQGFTCTSFNLKTSIVSISRASSPKQFMNSIAHEAKHVVEDICAYYNITLKGEESAYMIGEITMIMYNKFKEYICEC